MRKKHAAATVLSCLAIGALGVGPVAAQEGYSTVVDVVEIGITGSLELMTSGAATSAELTEAYLARIAAYDDELNAVIAVNPEALADAAARDAERAAGIAGPLQGVPIVIKDLIDLDGMATTNGALAFADYLPDDDATVVEKLEAAGAVIIAKTNLSEFAWSGDDSISGIGGEVHNPYDLSRTSGGSSGGTAAAVAASLGAAGLGSDTYGSIRTPSAHQALVGVRPTHGLVSLSGVTPQVEPQDTVGPMALSVADAAILLDVIAGSDPEDHWSANTPDADYTAELSTDALVGARILNFTAASFRGGDVADELVPARDEMLALQDAAIAELAAQGAEVIDVELTDEQLSAISGRGWYGMAGYLDEYFANNPAAWPAGLAELAEPADALTVADYIADGREIESIANDADWLLSTSPLDAEVLAANDARAASALAAWNALLDGYEADAVVFPTDALPASTAPVSYANARNAGLASGLGTPSVTVPVGYTTAGLPAGLEITGRQYSEPTLLGFAYAYEQATSLRVAPSATPALPLTEQSIVATPEATVAAAEPALAATGADAALPSALAIGALALGLALLGFRRRRA